MNIKNERVHALAREAARRSGTSQTSAIETALELYLDSMAGAGGPTAHDQERADLVRRLVADFGAALTDQDRAGIRGAITSMYDDSGLPV